VGFKAFLTDGQSTAWSQTRLTLETAATIQHNIRFGYPVPSMLTGDQKSELIITTFLDILEHTQVRLATRNIAYLAQEMNIVKKKISLGERNQILVCEFATSPNFVWSGKYEFWILGFDGGQSEGRCTIRHWHR
jgi:hypothetical protein